MLIRAFIAHFDDAVGYDLQVLSDQASAADYLAALNQFQDDYVAPCKGCDNCCWERIPLTSLDVQVYLAEPRVRQELDPALPALTAFVHRFGHAHGEGPVLDISLRQEADCACVWLDRQNQCCRLHQARSLVCQSFICLPHSQRAGQLRDTLLNVGEDQLVHEYLLEADSLGQAPLLHSARDARPQLADYPATPYAGKTGYSQLLLKDVVPPDLWEKLRQD